MIRRVLFGIVVALISAAPHPAAAAPKATTEPAATEEKPSPVPALLGALKAEATTWADQSKATAPALHAAVKKLSLTPANLAALRNVIVRSHSRQPLERLYITHQLLLPFRAAPPEEAKRLMPLLPRITAPLRYQPVVILTRRELAACNVPKEGELTPEIIERMHEAKIRREQREQAVIKNNVLVRQIKATAAEVQILSGVAAADRAVLRAVIADLNRNLDTYTDGLAAIAKHAKTMTPVRAAFLYEKLNAMVPRVGNRRLGFTNPATLRGGGQKNSTFGATPRMPGADLANAVNALAGPAGKPTVAVPKPEPKPKKKPKKKPVQPKPR